MSTPEARAALRRFADLLITDGARDDLTLSVADLLDELDAAEAKNALLLEAGSLHYVLVQKPLEDEVGGLAGQITEARRALRYMDMAGIQTALGGAA